MPDYLVDKLKRATTLPSWAQVSISPAEAKTLLALIERSALPHPSAPAPAPTPEPIPFGAPPVDPCGNCGCDKDWHRSRGCTGDFLCCPCKGWVP